MSQPSQVEAVFFAALEKKTPEERAAFLDSACDGDFEVRRQVERLLNAHSNVGNFLQKSVADQLSALGTDATQILDSTAGEGSGDDNESLDFLEPSTRSDSLGRLGHYEVLEVLGRGGFGIVFRAFDETLQRVVAIKVLSPLLAATSPARKRFLREARSSAKVRHENIVQVYAVEEQPLPYLVMEYIPGETLHQKLDRTGPLETEEVVHLGVQIAEGLAAAHAKGLIHRDIKPGNILIEAGNEVCVKITDFGLARAADDASVTQSGFIAGTPMFMAPEQALGTTLDHRADLFSLGSVLYTMSSGRPPFRANTTIAVLKRVVEDTPRPIPEIIPEVPQWLCDIISKLHAKKPEDRIATAKEVANLLSRGMLDTQKSGQILTFSETAPPNMENKTQEIPPAQSADQPAPSPTKLSAVPQPRPRSGRWSVAAALVLLSVVGLGLTEANGVTNVRGTIIRLLSPEGTLVVEIDDPAVSVKIDGSDLVITGAGAREIRLKPGNYTVEASKDGKVVTRELITVTNNGRQVVKVSQEAKPAPVTVAITTDKIADAVEWERSVAAMPAPEQVKAVSARMKELNPGFDGAVEPTIVEGVVTGLKFQTEHVSDLSPVSVFKSLNLLDCASDFSNIGKNGLVKDLSPLKGLPLRVFRMLSCPISDLSPLAGMPLKEINIERTQVSDLSPLRGAPLKTLNIYTTPVSDLSPLNGMPLESLQATGTRVSDLSPLRGAPLLALQCVATQVSDLSPLSGMPLQYLLIDRTQVSDLSPLAGMSIRVFGLGYTQVTDLSPLKDMPLEHINILDLKVADLSLLEKLPLKNLDCTIKCQCDAKIVRKCSKLEIINTKPTAEFWQEHDTRQAEFEKWVQQTSTLPAEQQIAAVIAKLIERNPGYDGAVQHKIEEGAVTDIMISGAMADHVTDISPVRALTGLKAFRCGFTRQLADLSPLQGLKLTEIELIATRVDDLSPLKDMNLTAARFYVAMVSDLTPLAGNQELTTVLVDQTGVRDLSPLKGLNLTTMSLGRTGVNDLSPLQGMKLTTLSFEDTAVTNVSTLKGMPLEQIRLTPTSITQGMDVLREIQTLKSIGAFGEAYRPAEEFWSRYDKGEFRK